MVKSTRTRRNGKAKTKKAAAATPQRSSKQVVARVRSALDNHAVAWARLLNDPCNAPLTYPCFSSAGGGSVLLRLEWDQLLGNAAGETASFYAWIPGLGLGLVNDVGLTSDTFGAKFTSANSAGSSWLPASAGSVRCVAACVQLMYPGSELDRSGIVSMGVIPAETLIINSAAAAGGGGMATSASAVRTICAHTERTPSTMVEAKWYPGEGDEEPVPGTVPTLWAPTLAGRNAIIFSASGLKAAVGIRMRQVAIFEISLYSAAGIVGSVQSAVPPASMNTAAQVLRTMFTRDAQWWLETAAKTSRALTNTISYAAAGAKAAGMAVNGLAIMAA
nr:hypothetical protein [Sobelivirales sp.]